MIAEIKGGMSNDQQNIASQLAEFKSSLPMDPREVTRKASASRVAASFSMQRSGLLQCLVLGLKL